MRTFLPAACAAALLLAGCGGGAGALRPPAGPVVQNPANPPSAGAPQSVTMTVVLGGRSGAVAGNVRRPKFVSPSTNGIDIKVYAHGGNTVLGESETDISSGSAACGGHTGLPRTCTVSVPAPPGSDDFVGTTYDAAPSGGSFSGAHVLGIGAITATINQGQANGFALYISGVINSLGYLPSNASLPADGSAHTLGFILNPADFDDNAITAGSNDPYANPITVQINESGGSGHAVVVKNGTPSGTSATLTKSSDTVSIQYDGGGAPGYDVTVSVSASGVTPETLTISPMYVTTASPYSGSKSLTFTANGQQAEVDVSETGAGSPTYAANGCAGVVTTSQTPGAPGASAFTVTASGNGSCTLTFSDGTSSIPWSVVVSTTSGSVTINSHTVGPITFASYSDGPLGGQNGWQTNSCGGNDYDAAVVDTSSFPSANWNGYPTPAKAMRFSNAVTQGCFSGLGSPNTPSSAGYPSALADTSLATPTQCGPTCETFWTEEFVVTSATGAFQPQLEMSISPVWNNQGARMSYVGLWHTVDSNNNPKLLVFGYDVEGIDTADFPGGAPCFQCANFVGYELAYVDATVPHKIGMTMQFVQPKGDVVKYYVDGVQVGIPTPTSYRSWEDYYLNDTESDPGYTYPYSRAVNDLLFRAGNVDGCVNFADDTCTSGPSGHAANAGKGFLFTNITTCAGSQAVCSAAIQTSSVRRSAQSMQRGFFGTPMRGIRGLTRLR